MQLDCLLFMQLDCLRAMSQLKKAFDFSTVWHKTSELKNINPNFIEPKFYVQGEAANVKSKVDHLKSPEENAQPKLQSRSTRVIFPNNKNTSPVYRDEI